MNLREVGLLADLGIPALIAICMIGFGFQTPPKQRGVDDEKYRKQLTGRVIVRWCGVILLAVTALRFFLSMQVR